MKDNSKSLIKRCTLALFLNKTMRNYTLLLLLLIISSGLNAQIISISTNDTFQIDIPTSGLVQKNLDINQDGIDDINFTKSSTSSDFYCSIYGKTDSADILHEYFQSTTGNMSGWKISEMTDSTISSNSNWMALQSLNPTAIIGGGHLHHTNALFPTSLINKRFFLGFRIFIEDNFIFKPHYGCLDMTLTQNEILIVHGWSYQTQSFTSISCDNSLITKVNYFKGKNEFHIFPNPTTGKITIDLEETKSNLNLILTNALGQVVLTKNYKSINYINLDLNVPKGLYYLRLECNGEVTTKKILKG